MQAKKEGAEFLSSAPRCGNVSRLNYNTGHAIKSNETLKDQIGLLMWRLQSPLDKHQLRAGWSLLGVLLAQYLADKGGL